MSYAKSISIRKDLSGFVVDEQKSLGHRLLTPLVIETPVDTGRARFNWIVSQNNPDNTQKPSPVSKDAAINSAIAAGGRVIASTVPYSLTYIQNNLPYIVKLNEGWSRQQPAAKYIDRIIYRVVKI